jgi:nitroreductase
MSKVQNNFLTRRSIYRFSNRDVEHNYLEIGFEAARHAPCHKQTHPWKFYIMGKETRNKIIPIVELMAREKAIGSKEDIKFGINKAISKIKDAPALIAVTTSININDTFRDEEDYAATVCALHNFVLSMWEQGIGSQWSTGSITRHDMSYRALNISSEEERIIGFIRVGYPDVIPERKKKSISEIRFYLP